MTARDEILGRVRTALGNSPRTPAADEIPRGYRMSTELSAAATVELLAERIADYRATVHRVTDAEIGGRITEILRERGAGSVVIPAGLPVEWQPQGIAWTTDDGSMPIAALDSTDAVVTTCAVAIAETGTLVLDGGAGQGRRAITLVPDHHVCIVPAGRIVASVPEAIAALDATRPMTFISGPSATSDIELERVEGVHGPRVLDVVIVQPLP